ncbi:MAG: hypothetical protein PHD02_00830 [Bacilli bacterium]|nr:hypothetical protein [Bacilli bacterium]
MKRRINKQNVFIFISIIFIVGLFLIYFNRLIYYKIFFNDKNENITDLAERLIKNNVLLEENNEYYFYGKSATNYVVYSSQLWQVIKINNDEITLISMKPITNLFYDTEYNDSVINSYLTDDFYNILDNRQIVNTTTCVNDLNNEIDDCSNPYENTVVLLSLSLYDKLGGKDSFINNGYYTYLSNGVDKHYYIDENGEVNITYSQNLYGIKPIITIKTKEIISGSGTQNDPYILDEAKNILSEASVGSYIRYGNKLWRILKNEDSTRLICNEIIENYLFENSTFNIYNSVYQYLNNEFINSLNQNILLESKFYNGEYIDDIRSIFYSTTAYVGLPFIMDLYLNDLNSYALINTTDNSNLVYTVNSKGMTVQSNSDYYGIRPIITIENNLTITGLGTINSPYIIEGESNE